MASRSGVNSGQIISGQNIVNQNVYYQYPSTPGIYPGIDILLAASALNAAVDSEARAYTPRCFPGTRKQYIEDITNWATASTDDHSLLVYRMNGPAGVGKTAIAQTCAERVKERGKLGASFFFSVNGCNDHKSFFTTIAYQLSTVFPDYKKNLNDRILNDKTIVNKAIAFQFEELIIGPLQELKKLGKEVGVRAIFIDGVDECQSPEAQSQIIELIATSVRHRTTPFRWAFFSRAEVHIEATFNLNLIIPLHFTVELPISREIDQEIQLYLEGGFKNILRRQSLSFSLPWPPPGTIQTLVDASAGLYAYPAAVLRFIESFPSGNPKEALALILEVVSRPNPRSGPLSPFAELDAFYTLIMQRIPDQLLPSIQYLFATIVGRRLYFHSNTTFGVAPVFNRLQLSEEVLNGIRKHLHAVIFFQDALPMFKLGSDIDVTRPYYEQRHPAFQERNAIYSSLGTLTFRHKSFHDFLADPDRSASFNVTSTLEMELKRLEQHLRVHFDLAQNYVEKGTGLITVSGVRDYAAVLSLPPESGYINSYLQDHIFVWCTDHFTSIPGHSYFPKVSHCSLQKLSQVDYRKYLLVSIRFAPGFSGVTVDGRILTDIRNDVKSQFRRIRSENDFINFLAGIELLKNFRVIKPYHQSFKSRLEHFFEVKRSKSKAEHSGLYTLGRGEKGVLWYWEYDMNSSVFYQFWTLDLKRAMEIFKASKYDMWSDDWTPPSF